MRETKTNSDEEIEEDDIVMLDEELKYAEPCQCKKKLITRSDFDILKFIGEGANAKVYKIWMKKSGKIYALKQVRIKDAKWTNALNGVLLEWRILVSYTHIRNKYSLTFWSSWREHFQRITHSLLYLSFVMVGNSIFT